MAPAAALLVCVLLAALALLQLLLVAGRPLGRLAWGGQHRVLPARLRVGSAVSVVVYALVGWVVLARAGLVGSPLSDRAGELLAWGVAGYFLLGTGLNAASRSPAERAVMTPVAAVLCVLCVVVALG